MNLCDLFDQPEPIIVDVLLYTILFLNGAFFIFSRKHACTHTLHNVHPAMHPRTHTYMCTYMQYIHLFIFVLRDIFL